MKKVALTILVALSVSSTAFATDVSDQMIQQFKLQGASTPDADRGQTFWNQKFISNKANEQRSCATCHTSNVKQMGRHATTGKDIKPLAPSVMSKRLSNPKKINKWFRRNCSWVLGRECNAQEKADVLMYLSQQ